MKDLANLPDEDEPKPHKFYDAKGKFLFEVGSNASVPAHEMPTAFTVRLPSTEILTVTKQGEFHWHPDAERLIEEGDFSGNEAMQHILRKLWSAESCINSSEKYTCGAGCGEMETMKCQN